MCVYLVTCGSMNNKEVAIQTNACWLLLLLLPVLYLTPPECALYKEYPPLNTDHWILNTDPPACNGGEWMRESPQSLQLHCRGSHKPAERKISNTECSVQFTNREIYTYIYEQICGLHLTSAKNRKKPQLYVHFHHKITIDYKMLVNFEILIFWKYNLNAFKCCWGVRWALWNWRERNERLKCITQNQYRLLGALQHEFWK